MARIKLTQEQKNEYSEHSFKQLVNLNYKSDPSFSKKEYEASTREELIWMLGEA